jgi:hypothetical protein
LTEEVWHKSAAYPWKDRTGEHMAHRPAEPFEEHAAHLCRLLNIEQEGNQYFLAASGLHSKVFGLYFTALIHA